MKRGDTDGSNSGIAIAGLVLGIVGTIQAILLTAVIIVIVRVADEVDEDLQQLEGMNVDDFVVDLEPLVDDIEDGSRIQETEPRGQGRSETPQVAVPEFEPPEPEIPQPTPLDYDLSEIEPSNLDLLESGRETRPEILPPDLSDAFELGDIRCVGERTFDDYADVTLSGTLTATENIDMLSLRTEIMGTANGQTLYSEYIFKSDWTAGESVDFELHGYAMRFASNTLSCNVRAAWDATWANANYAR